jgi:hypothetical protein
MRQYYSRFLRQTWKNLIKDGVPQVIGAVLAFAILLCQIRFGAVPHDLAWPNVWSIAWPYGALCAALALWAALRAPVQLDKEQATQIADVQQLNAQLESHATAPKVSPWEQKQRHLVVEKLKDFPVDEQGVIEHILHHGETDRGALAKMFNLAVVDRATSKGVSCNLLTPGRSGLNWTVNPHFHLALSFHFDGE